MSRPIACIAVAQLGRSLARQLDPQQHGEQALLVVIVHLDLGDVRPLPRHVMNDRVGQAAIVGSDGGDGDLHGERMWKVGGGM